MRKPHGGGVCFQRGRRLVGNNPVVDYAALKVKSRTSRGDSAVASQLIGTKDGRGRRVGRWYVRGRIARERYVKITASCVLFSIKLERTRWPGGLRPWRAGQDRDGSVHLECFGFHFKIFHVFLEMVTTNLHAQTC